jgi:hypothetical protein
MTNGALKRSQRATISSVAVRSKPARFGIETPSEARGVRATPRDG